jgi:hypothetical protein
MKLPQQLKRFHEEKYRKSSLKKFDDEIEKAEAIVVAMYENHAFIITVITSLDDAGRQLSWQDIEKNISKILLGRNHLILIMTLFWAQPPPQGHQRLR